MGEYSFKPYKIAESLGFENGRQLLTYLPDDISQHMTREKWDAFFAKYGKVQEEAYQRSRFNEVSTTQHPSFDR